MKDIESENPFERYSLRGKGKLLAESARSPEYALGSLCLFGQATVIYAKYNTGKTLILLYLIAEAIYLGRIRGEDMYYINADDDAFGIGEKGQILEQLGAHMLVPGYRGFRNSLLVQLMTELILLDQCAGKLIVLDTLKKFTDLMDKKAGRYFNDIIRQFVLKGGTVVALAHVNKHPDANRRPIPEGTGDVLNDFDCGYLLHDYGVTKEGWRIVRFEREKNRGKSTLEARYVYDPKPDLDYLVRLQSVSEVDLNDDSYCSLPIVAEEEQSVIDAIESAIKHDPGGRGKMEIARIVSDARGVSRRAALKVLEHYTGDDPKLHRWTYKRLDRGRMQYSLLERPEGNAGEALG